MYSGGNKKIKIKRFERIKGEQPSECSSCRGSGQVKRVSNSFLGQVVNITECNNCNGSGIIGGREKKIATIEFDVPKGVSSDHYHILENEVRNSRYLVEQIWYIAVIAIRQFHKITKRNKTR